MEIFDVMNVVLSVAFAYFMWGVGRFLHQYCISVVIDERPHFSAFVSAVAAVLLRLSIAAGVPDIYQKSLAVIFWIALTFTMVQVRTTLADVSTIHVKKRVRGRKG